MSKDQYKAWLTSVPEDNTKAKCKVCAKTFSLSSMGEQALQSHPAGNKHITVVNQTQKTDSVTDFSVKCGVTPKASSSASLGEASTQKFGLRKEQHKDEILWFLKCVMSHFSFNSSTDITDIFKAMFLDSTIEWK